MMPVVGKEPTKSKDEKWMAKINTAETEEGICQPSKRFISVNELNITSQSQPGAGRDGRSSIRREWKQGQCSRFILIAAIRAGKGSNDKPSVAPFAESWVTTLRVARNLVRRNFKYSQNALIVICLIMIYVFVLRESKTKIPMLIMFEIWTHYLLWFETLRMISFFFKKKKKKKFWTLNE